MEEILDQNNLIKPGTPAWEYAVADGRGTKDALQWRRGDWANRICPVGKDGVNNNAFENLEQYAKELGVELKTLLGYRGVAFVFEPTLRGVGSSFSIYKALQKYPHLIHQKPKTVREAMKLVKDEDARLAAEATAHAEEAARVAAEARAQADREIAEERIRAEERARVEAEHAEQLLHQQQERAKVREEQELARVLKEQQNQDVMRRQALLPDDPDYLASPRKSDLSVLLTFASDTAKLRIHAKRIADVANSTDILEWTDDQKFKALADIEQALNVVTQNLNYVKDLIQDPTSDKFSDEKIKEWLTF